MTAQTVVLGTDNPSCTSMDLASTSKHGIPPLKLRDCKHAQARGRCFTEPTPLLT